MIPFREAVNLRKAYRKLNFRVLRGPSSQAYRGGRITIGRYEEDPIGKLRQWLPYAHQSAAIRGFSALTNQSKNMGTRIERLIELNRKLPDIINFAAEDDYNPHRVERALIGNPLSTAIHGRPGQRFKGAAAATGRNVVSIGGGTIGGAAVGGGIGAGIGALRAIRHGPSARAFSPIIHGAIGAEIGGLTGGTIGAAHATFGKKAEEAYKRRTYGMSSKLTRLVELNSKMSRIIELDDDSNHPFKTAAELAGAAGVGAGGIKAYQAIKQRQMGSAGVLVGGENAGLTTAPTFGSAAADVGKSAISAAPGAIKSGLAAAGTKGMSALDKVLAAFKVARIP